MRKLFILILSTFFANVTFAQNASQFNIIWGPLNVDVEYDSEMRPLSHRFTLIFQDSDYEVLDRRFVYAEGTAQDIFDSLKFIEDFAAKYNKMGMKMTYGDVKLMRFTGLLNGVNVDLGDKRFNIDMFTIKQVKKRLVKYCKQHKLDIPIYVI